MVGISRSNSQMMHMFFLYFGSLFKLSIKVSWTQCQLLKRVVFALLSISKNFISFHLIQAVPVAEYIIELLFDLSIGGGALFKYDFQVVHFYVSVFLTLEDIQQFLAMLQVALLFRGYRHVVLSVIRIYFCLFDWLLLMFFMMLM